MKIQSNQQNFGTRVLMRPGTKEIIEKSKAKKEIFKQVENLKNNGVDDFLILSHNEVKSVPHINAEIVEFIGEKCHINSFSKGYPLLEMVSKGERKYLNIESVYKLSKVKMVEVGMITRNLFDTMLHEYQEI